MIYNVYFSPTGTTKKVVQTLSTTMEGQIKEIDLSDSNFLEDEYSFCREDVVIVGVPSFGGRMVVLARNRISKFFLGNGAKAIIIATYGNRAYDDQLLEMYDLMNDCGFEVVGAIGAVCRHSIVNEVASNRPNEKDIETLHKFSKVIQDHMNEKHSFNLPGNRPFKEARQHFPFLPITSDACNGCGMCVNTCVHHAITLKDGIAHTNNDECISCMRCIQVCPMHARALEPEVYASVREKMLKNCSSYKEYELFI